jgi:hypothetical protein
MLPTLFIGSSSEGINIARAVKAELDRDATVTVWDQNVFSISEYPLESLLRAARGSDFAAFVFSPDDVLRLRGEVQSAVRDNVIYELGLFTGELGRGNVFIIKPRGEDLRIPTDLIGIQPGEYDSTRADGNLRAALGTACDSIRKKLRTPDRSFRMSDEVERQLGLKGISGFQSGSLVDDEFLRSQNKLDIFLKDGHTFFKNEQRRAAVRYRLIDARKTTRVFIVHPDYNYIQAVANMDEKKYDKPHIQIDDCRGSIEILQSLADEIRVSGDEKVTIRNEFIGINLVPTWNGFVGDTVGYVYMYYTRPYNGPLNRIEFQRTINDDDLYNNFSTELRLIRRFNCMGDLWKYRRP